MKSYYWFILVLMPFFILVAFQSGDIEKPVISSETDDCKTCHTELHPGIVKHWYNSRHSKITVAEAFKKPEIERRISTSEIEPKLQNVVVGCYECHSLNTDKHQDAFEHNGYIIKVVVSPDDCATYHEVEADQYSRNMMAHAYSNLMDNPLYQDLKKSINGKIKYEHHNLSIENSNDQTESESCLYCHDNKLIVTGKEIRETEIGEMEFPVISGWPNQGVGRINTDGSKGAYTACHPRHDFSIETARKPYTCAQCHKGPDVPAYKVYQASKHGNIFSSKGDKFDFTAVPWKVGQVFTVPTCETYHTSLIVDENDAVIAERTHQFNDRLAWQLFGVPYAHPHPIWPEIKNIKNSAGLPIAVELNSDPVPEFLIDDNEMQIRDDRMKKIYQACHSTDGVNSNFDRLENTIKTTNELTLTATKIISEIWDKGYAKGLPQNENIFDEEIERTWTTIWLFHANSICLSSAMG